MDLQRAKYVMGNESGDLPIGTIGVIAAALLIIVGLLLVKDQAVAFLTKAAGNIGKWTSQI